MNCPCGSQEPYMKCCGRYHLGQPPPSALHLMKARYSAYALKKVDFILQTTHPEHPDSKLPIPSRRKQIKLFCDNTEFQKLEILAVEEMETTAYVTFCATLKQQGKDASFTERSFFEKLNGTWFYKSGEMIQNSV